MSGETVVTIVGYLVGDPSCGAPLRESRSRIPLRRTSRGFLDRASGTWKDGDAGFLRARLWRHRAENAAETPCTTRDASHIFCGRLRKRTSGIAAGAQRTEVEVEEIGFSQRYATAAVSYVARATRSSTPAGSISRRTSRRPDPRLGAQPAPAIGAPPPEPSDTGRRSCGAHAGLSGVRAGAAVVPSVVVVARGMPPGGGGFAGLAGLGELVDRRRERLDGDL